MKLNGLEIVSKFLTKRPQKCLQYSFCMLLNPELRMLLLLLVGSTALKSSLAIICFVQMVTLFQPETTRFKLCLSGKFMVVTFLEILPTISLIWSQNRILPWKHQYETTTSVNFWRFVKVSIRNWWECQSRISQKLPRHFRQSKSLLVQTLSTFTYVMISGESAVYEKEYGK